MHSGSSFCGRNTLICRRYSDYEYDLFYSTRGCSYVRCFQRASI